MIQYSHSDIKRLIVCGDVHGEFKEFFHKIRINAVDKMSFEDIPLEQVIDDKEVLEKLKTYLEDLPSHIKEEINCYKRGSRSLGLQEMKDCVIIVAGDCGFGFNKEEYYHQIFNKYIPLLEQNNIFIYFVRGNHDDPSYFEEQKINYERIKTVPDYSVIKIDDKNILCVGGAISIDRTWRKQKEFVINKHKKEHKKKLYWEDEAPIYFQEKLEEICENGIVINGIISHTNPHFAYPPSKSGAKNWARVDKELHNDVNNERNTLTNIYDFFKGKKMNLDFWCYGHHHVHNTQNYEKTTMYAINEMQFKQIQLTEEKKDSFFSKINWANYQVSSSITELANALNGAEYANPLHRVEGFDIDTEIPRPNLDANVINVDDLFIPPTMDIVEEENLHPQNVNPIHIGEGIVEQIREQIDNRIREAVVRDGRNVVQRIDIDDDLFEL